MRFIDPAIEEYCINKSNVPSEICQNLAEETRKKVPKSMMLVGEMEASFIGFLIKAIKAKSILEIGTFTGYSALAMAEQLPSDGRVLTLDISQETVDFGKKFWNQSPHGQKITSVIGEALKTLRDLDDKFDLIFIDADKENYSNYLDIGLSKLTENGVILLDNCLWSGKVLEDKNQESSTNGIRNVTQMVLDRVDCFGTLLPIRDGIFLIKRV